MQKNERKTTRLMRESGGIRPEFLRERKINVQVITVNLYYRNAKILEKCQQINVFYSLKISIISYNRDTERLCSFMENMQVKV